MINERQARKFCGEDLYAIENYEQAVSDKTQVWDIHHRLEIQGPFTNSRELLKKCGLYYGVQASQLVFMTRSEHIRLHRKGRPLSKDTRQKLSEANKGRRHSEETRRKLSEANKGRSNGMLGKHHSEETRRKLSEAQKGRHFSEEHRRKLCEAWRKRKEEGRG